MQTININYNGYHITTNKDLMKLDDIHRWLSESAYWSKNIPFEIVKRAFENSYCIGVIKDGKQVGYARLITDYASFAYLADVFVEETHRGQHLSKKMMDLLLNQDWVKGLRKIMLATVNAHGLYRQYGFDALQSTERFMEISRPGVYGDIENICR